MNENTVFGMEMQRMDRSIFPVRLRLRAYRFFS